MPEINDLHEQDADSGNASGNVSSTGQSINWEARFKGLQKKYEQLKQNFEAKEAVATQLQVDLNAEKAARRQEVQQLQAQLTEKDAAIQTLNSDLEAHKALVATKDQEIARFTKESEVRKLLAPNPDNPDEDLSAVLPFFEKGLINVDGLEGDALRQKLVEFNLLMKGKVQASTEENVNQKLEGLAPTPPAPGGGKAGDELTMEQLADWLSDPANEDKPEFAKMEQIYLQKVRQSLSNQ